MHEGRSTRERPGTRATARLLAALVAVVVALCSGGLAATAQDASAPAASLAPGSSSAPAASLAPVDPLADSLLGAADLPVGMLPAKDVQEGTDYDIDDAAFVANDGIRVVSRTWGMETDAGTSIVFDFRMQFATPEAASAYLVSALPTLSETATTGLVPLTDVPAIGEETRAYGRDTEGDLGSVTIRTYLFRVGTVVAKVLAGGAGMTGADVQVIAEAAGARMAASGPPAPGSPRPRPTPIPSASPTATVPSGDLTGLLLAHVPGEIGPTCTPDAQRLWDGELVTLVCAPTDADVQVTYSGFDTADHMGRAYQSSLDSIDLSTLAAACDLGTWTGSYEVDGAVVGQIACWSEPNGRAIMWSDDRLSILSVAVSPSLDPSGLYQWWLGAGPVP